MLRLLALLLGPMFAKEMLEISRRKRYFFNRVFYGMALLLVLFFVWEEMRFGYDWRTGQMQLAAAAEMALVMFQSVSWVQLGAVFLFVPVFVSGVISTEREGGTLDLLLTTQLKDREIVLGKLASRLVVVVLLMASALPVFSLIMLFGGIQPAALVRSQFALLLALLYVGAHSVYFSATSRSPMGALVRTYWWMALWLLAMPLAVTFTLEVVFRNILSVFTVQFIFSLMAMTNPLFLYATSVHQEAYNEFYNLLGIGHWFYPALYLVPLAWSIFLLVRAVQRLRLPPTLLTRLGNMSAFIRDSRDAWTDMRKALAEGRRARAPWTRWGAAVTNPLWLRSRLARVYDREGHVGRIQLGGWLVALFFLMMFAMFEANAFDDEEMSMVFLSPCWIGVALLTVVIAASSLVGDRHRGLFELILTTPLEPREIVDGTVLAVWEHLRRIVWLPIILCLLFTLTTASHPVGVCCSLVTALLFAATILQLGVLCSLAARQAAAALAPTFIFAIFMTAGTGILIGLFEEGSGPVIWLATAILMPASWRWVRHSVSPAAVATHFLAVHLLLCCLATFWTWNGSSEEYPLCMMNPAFLTIVSLDNNFPTREIRHSEAAILALPIYWAALIGNLIWARWWMIRNFDRLTDRLSIRSPATPAVPVSSLTSPIRPPRAVEAAE